VICGLLMYGVGRAVLAARPAVHTIPAFLAALFVIACGMCFLRELPDGNEDQRPGTRVAVTSGESISHRLSSRRLDRRYPDRAAVHSFLRSRSTSVRSAPLLSHNRQPIYSAVRPTLWVWPYLVIGVWRHPVALAIKVDPESPKIDARRPMPA